MEFTELQALWQQQNAQIAENTRINKEILKRILKVKPERRINWVTLQTGAGLFINPIILLLFFTLAPITFNHGLALYLGISLYGCIVLLGFYWSIKYFMLLRNIDFTNSVTTTRKNLRQLEKFHTTRLKLVCLMFPIALIGVFLMFDIPITKESFVILPLMLVMMVVSIYYRFRWKNWWFGKLNSELDEIEQLEK